MDVQLNRDQRNRYRIELWGTQRFAALISRVLGRWSSFVLYRIYVFYGFSVNYDKQFSLTALLDRFTAVIKFQISCT